MAENGAHTPIVNLDEGWKEIKEKALDVLEKMIEQGVTNDGKFFNPAECVYIRVKRAFIRYWRGGRQRSARGAAFRFTERLPRAPSHTGCTPPRKCSVRRAHPLTAALWRRVGAPSNTITA
jgi:hypothetical protein